MRKKMGCLLALMALLSALTACGGDSAEDVSGTLPPETPMTPEETEFQSGRVEGGTYTNEFLSVACQLGDEWTYLTDEEIAALGVEKREIVVGYQVGDSVKITDGALESFLGTVEEIDLDRSKVRVVVSMFGRETPVELELDQVEPVNH